MDDFSDHPVSIAEIKSGKSHSGKDWSPRDALIAVLRDMDNGVINPDAVVVAFRHQNKDGTTNTGFSNATSDMQISLGLLECVKLQIFEAG